MNSAHLHLALNHIPILGTFFGTLLLAYALWRKSDEVKCVGLGVLFLAAAVSIPTYLSGERAEDVVEGLPGVSHHYIEEHESAAKVAYTGILVLGFVSLIGVILFRRAAGFPNWFALIVLVFALVESALLGRTANLGGMIHHPEIRGETAPAAEGENHHH